MSSMHVYGHDPELPAFAALLQPPRHHASSPGPAFTYEPIASLAVGRAAPLRHAYPQFPLPSFRFSPSLSASPVTYRHDDSDGSLVASQRRVATNRDAHSRRPARASRYLRESDRHEILQRIESGEKQADLAKEYNVSRAAISNLKQRRKLKERQQQQQLSHSPSSDESGDSRRSVVRPAVRTPSSSLSAANRAAVRRRCVVGGSSTTQLLSQLQRSSTSPATFRLSVQRLSRLLLEEALGRLPTHTQTDDGGVELTRPVCAFAVDDGGRVLLDELLAMEPTLATGSIVLDHSHPSSRTRAVLSREPPLLAASSVLLLQLTGSQSGEETVAAVEALQAAGVHSPQIFVVTLASYERGLVAVLTRKPRLGAMLTALSREEDASLDREDGDKQNVAQRLRTWLAERSRQ